MFQHMKENEGEHSAVVWDAAPISHIPGSLPPSDLVDTEPEGKENNTEHNQEGNESTDMAKDRVCNLRF